MKIRICIVTCFILVSFSLCGQHFNYFFKKYSIRDGLPSNHVRWITQDRTGFLWIATWDGLVRYDGSEFRVYQHNPNDPTSVAFFEIIKVCVDSNNHVWVFAGGKLCRYFQRYDHFATYGADKFPPYDSAASPIHFHDILIDPQGLLVTVNDNGFYRYDPEADKFDEVPGLENLIRLYQPFFSAFDRNGDLWIMRTDFAEEYGKVFRGKYDPGRIFTVRDSFPFEQQNFRGLFNNETVHLRAYINPGQVWLTTNHGLFILENDTFRICQGKVPHGNFPYEEVMAWSQPGQGLVLHYPGEDISDTLFRAGEIETVIAYYIDQQDNIWFNDMSNPTQRQGLNLAYRTGDFFRHYLSAEDNSSEYAIFGLLKDREGNIWAGGRPNGHLLKIRPDGSVQKINLPFSPVGNFSYPRNIAMDEAGNLWIAFFYDHLFRLNPKTLEFTDFSDVSTLDRDSRIHNLYRLVSPVGNGLMAAGGGGKLHVFDPVSGHSVSAYTPNKWDMYCIYPHHDGSLWVGLSGRLLKTDIGLREQEVFEIIEPYYNVEDIVAGDSSDLWLALLGGGIGHFDTRTGKTEFYTTWHGLAHNTVYGIRKDRSGNLWVSHNLGISMYNPLTKSFINFSDQDGLYIREFDSEAVHQTAEGELIFGGIGGIVSFYPDSVKKIREDSPSNLIISEFRVSNQIIRFNRPTYATEHFLLPKGTDNFQIAFVRPDFRYGDEMQYRYRLKEVQSEWTVTDSKHRMVNYTSLQYGRYEFQVESTGLNGDWKYQTSVVIEIPRHFYQTLAFKTLVILIVISLIILFFTMKLKQMKLNERKKQEQLKLETLRGQMNPHFIYNSLNSINYFISRNDRLNANQFISDFSRLIRAIMTNSSQDYISLESEIEAIREYLALEHLRFSDKFDYEIRVDEEIDQVSMEVIPSIIQPFIENAIWHGVRYLEKRKGFLSVRFALENGLLVGYVEDDGIGRKLSLKLKSDEQKKRRSRGIAMSEERLNIINTIMGEQYSIRITNLYDDRKETGTAVRIEIPFKKPQKNVKL